MQVVVGGARTATHSWEDKQLLVGEKDEVLRDATTWATSDKLIILGLRVSKQHRGVLPTKSRTIIYTEYQSTYSALLEKMGQNSLADGPEPRPRSSREGRQGVSGFVSASAVT